MCQTGATPPPRINKRLVSDIPFEGRASLGGQRENVCSLRSFPLRCSLTQDKVEPGFPCTHLGQE